MVKQKNKNIDYKIKWFTLVELIIVITILSVLGTIAFISFKLYTKNARDWNRLASITNIDKWLNLYSVNAWYYPKPDNTSWTWQLNWVIINYVWDIWDNISRLIKANKTPKDPLSWNNYVYWVSYDFKSYQIATILENSEEISLKIFSKTYANNTQYKSRVIWNYNWIIKFNNWNTYIANVPSLIFNSTWTINLISQEPYFVVNKWLNLPYSVNNVTKNNKIKQDVMIESWITATWVIFENISSISEANWETVRNSLKSKLWVDVNVIWESVFWKEKYSEIKKDLKEYDNCTFGNWTSNWSLIWECSL